MKKIFTLSWLAWMCCITAMAQNLNALTFVDKSGNTLPNGTTLTVKDAVENDFGDILLPSGLCVKNNSAADQGVRVICNIKTIDNGNMQICFPTNCISKNAAGQFNTSSGMMAAGETIDLQSEWLPTADGRCTVVYQLQLMTPQADNPLKYDEGEMGPTLTVKYEYGNVGSDEPETQAGQYLCGLYTTDDLAEYGSGMGSYTKGACKVATPFDSQVTASFDGFKVIGMRVGLVEKITGFGVFVDKIVDGNISSFVSKEVGSASKGWNTVMFDESEQFTLSASEVYLVGFSYNQKNTVNLRTGDLTDDCYPISYYENSDNKGIFYFYGNIPSSAGGSGQGWYSLDNTGALSVQLIVKGELPDQHVIIGTLTADKKYYQRGGELTWSFDLTNMGKNAIESADVNIYIDDVAISKQSHTASIAPTQKGNISGRLPLPSDIPLLGHTLRAELAAVNGSALTGEVENNNPTRPFNVFAQSVAHQKYLVEHFTSNTCTYCPRGYNLMRRLTADYDDVAWVSIHGNMNGKDPLNFTECDQIESMEGLMGWPGASFNRIYDASWAEGEATLIYGIGYPDQYIAGVEADIRTLLTTSADPAFVTLDIQPVYDASTRNLSITVNGTGVESASQLLANDGLTIYLTEEGLTGRQLNAGTWVNNYEHNNALRMVATSYGGDDITWDGDNFSLTKSVTIPADCVAENMTITAFVAPQVNGSTPADIYNMSVNNCAQAAVTQTADGIHTASAVHETQQVVSRYNEAGQQITTPKRGLNIVKMSDGTIRKEIRR